MHIYLSITYLNEFIFEQTLKTKLPVPITIEPEWVHCMYFRASPASYTNSPYILHQFFFNTSRGPAYGTTPFVTLILDLGRRATKRLRYGQIFTREAFGEIRKPV